MGMLDTGAAAWPKTEWDHAKAEAAGTASVTTRQPRSSGHQFERKVFYAGQPIFREGQEGHEAYVVQSGQVEIFKADPGERDRVLAVLETGALFGEMALIDDQPRSANARAVRDTVCIVLKKHEFKRRLKEASPWMQAMFRILVQNLRTANDPRDVESSASGPSDADAPTSGSTPH